MPEGRRPRKRAAAKKAAASRRETATEKAKRLEAELTALRSTVEDLVTDYRDELCETGLTDARNRLKEHGVKIDISDRLEVRFVMYLNVDGLDERLVNKTGTSGYEFTGIGVETDLVIRVADALTDVIVDGMDIKAERDASYIERVTFA